MREHALFQPGEEHGVEFQALGRVECHEGDDAVTLVGDLIGIRDQRDPLQERTQGIVRLGHADREWGLFGVFVVEIRRVRSGNEF